MTIELILRALRWLGLDTLFETIRFALLRDRQNRRLAPDQGRPIPPGELLATEAAAGGAEFTFANATLAVRFLSNEAVRIQWGPGTAPPPYAVASPADPTPMVDWTESDAGWRLATPALRVDVSPRGQVRIATADGRELRSEAPPVRHGDRWRGTSRLLKEEVISGLGERTAGLNLRDGTYRFWNTDPGGSYGWEDDPLYICPPVYLSLRPEASSLTYYENPHDGRLTLEGNKADIRFQAGQYRYLFLAGPPADLLDRFSQLIGRPALPPRWALKHHQARWGYRSQAEVEEVIDGFAEHELPLGALHLDIDYMQDYKVFTVDQDRFPDLEALSRRLWDRLEARLVCILDPALAIDEAWPLFRAARERGHLCQLPDGRPVPGVVWPGAASFPDFTDPAARSWWGSQYQGLLECGVAGFWHDMNEPTSFAAWGDSSLPLTTRHDLDGRGGDHRIAHNQYALLMNRAGYEALRAGQPDRRPWILSRSGWVGMSRHAWTWTGDVESSWEALRLTVPMVLGLGVSGIPFAGPDIGGFSGAPSEELYLRWFQLAAFLPFFRTHSSRTSPPREPWRFSERTLRACRELLNLRQRLLPYLYTLAAEAHNYGWPLVRPLYWHDPSRQELWSIEDAFLLGDHLLVAPALAEGQRSRRVRLPPGTWTEFWTGERHRGPDEITVATRLERPAVYVRAGAVLPQATTSGLELHFFPPAREQTRSRLYLDSGDGYGAHRWDRFFVRPIESGYLVTWDSEGTYPLPQAQLPLRFHGPSPHIVEIDGQSHTPTSGQLIASPFEELRVRVG